MDYNAPQYRPNSFYQDPKFLESVCSEGTPWMSGDYYERKNAQRNLAEIMQNLPSPLHEGIKWYVSTKSQITIAREHGISQAGVCYRVKIAQRGLKTAAILTISPGEVYQQVLDLYPRTWNTNLKPRDPKIILGAAEAISTYWQTWSQSEAARRLGQQQCYIRHHIRMALKRLPSCETTRGLGAIMNYGSVLWRPE